MVAVRGNRRIRENRKHGREFRISGVGAPGVRKWGRRRDGERAEEIWKGISVGVDGNGAAIGNGGGEEEPWVTWVDG